MKGHTITGNGTGRGITDTGTFVQSVAISNGKIRNFDEGIDFFGLDSDLITLERIDASSNKGDGIFIEGCCNSLTRIKANKNGGAGIFVDECCDVYNEIQANENGDEGFVTLGCCTGVNLGFPFSILIQSRTDTRRFANAMFEPGFKPGGLSITLQRTSSASRWHKGT